jgi:HlyD family secretion protein
MSPNTLSARRSIRIHLALGAIMVCLVAGGIGGWAATTQLAGAVIAQGHLVVDSNVKKVQHPTGGIVAELRVRDGDRVKAGDILVRLDDIQVRANVGIVAKDLDELIARRARLEAEQDDSKEVVFPQDLLDRADDPDVARVMAGERKLFELRRTARVGQKAQLKERVAQLRKEIDGILGQAAAKKHEIDFVNQELESVRDLWEKKLVLLSQLTALERDLARLEGERGQLIAAAAEAKGKIVETELQIIQVDQDLRSEDGKDLADVRAKISELAEQKIAAEDQLRRIEIRAPQSGRIHQLSVHTIGGVIEAGEPIMLIVPDADSLTVEAKVAPQDIDQLHLGQPAVLRFTTFNQRTTPELNGEVSLISADLMEDQRTGTSFYLVHVKLKANEIQRLGDVTLTPGMPVETFIQTRERTVLSYLVKPLRDQLQRSFREK